MGCLLAEFKLTAMAYWGRREGNAAFWVSPLCTLPLTLAQPSSLILPHVCSLSVCLDLTGEIWTIFWIQVCCQLVKLARGSQKTSLGNVFCQFFLFYFWGKKNTLKLTKTGKQGQGQLFGGCCLTYHFTLFMRPEVLEEKNSNNLTSECKYSIYSVHKLSPYQWLIINVYANVGNGITNHRLLIISGSARSASRSILMIFILMMFCTDLRWLYDKYQSLKSGLWQGSFLDQKIS